MVEQKSQKGAEGIVMKRKIYQQLHDWKEKRNGDVCRSKPIVTALPDN